VNKKIDTEDLEFDVYMEDVETLNQWSNKGKLDFTKLSFPALFHNLDKYVLLNAGAALGNGVGPLLISKKKKDFSNSEIENATIALPGEQTTANLLFSFAYPDAFKKKFILFSNIEQSVLKEETDFGVIIHENRFTYQQKGLHKVTDLGEFWESKMAVPIPLGGIAVKKSIGREIGIKVERLIKQSIEYGFSNLPLIPDYVKQHSQEMEEEVMKKHIGFYVNNFSIDLNVSGRQAITILYELYLNQVQKTNSSQSYQEIFLS
jgi:1,4-dihydroxy-6-naphthoate synthase